MKKYIFVIITFFILSTSILVAVDLKITEIYFAWTDEWIEISNTSSQDFSGDLTISWAKTSIINLSNLFISADSSALFGDSFSNVLDKTNVIYSGLSLNILDTKNLDVKLFQSWTELDSLFMTGLFLSELKTQKSSVQKIQSGSDFITTGSNINSGRNILPGYFGSPWKLYNRDDIFSNNQTWTNNYTGIVDLHITEVYFDWYDEWIEITNRWNIFFSGDLKLVWASTTPIILSNIFLSTGQSVIISQQEYFFVDQSVVILSGVMLTLQDETAITLSLIYSWNIIDTFQVQDSFVQIYNDQKTSFEKVKYNSEIITTISTESRNFNIISGYIANPWTTYFVWESVVNVSSWTVEDTGSIVNSWLICTWFQTQINISEIFLWDENYPAFIEIHAIQDFDDIIYFSGNLLQTGFSVALNLQADEYVIITTDTTPRFSITKTEQNSNVKLQSTWFEIIVSGQSWQVMDKAININLSTGFSVYPSGFWDCEQEFPDSERFTPWFSEELLSYYLETEPEIIYVNTCETSGW